MIFAPFRFDKYTLDTRIRCLDLPGEAGYSAFDLPNGQSVIKVY